MICNSMIESPPRWKKLSSRPTRSTRSTSPQTAANVRSASVCGSAKTGAVSPRSAPGCGRAARSSFPFGVRDIVDYAGDTAAADAGVGIDVLIGSALAVIAVVPVAGAPIVVPIAVAVEPAIVGKTQIVANGSETRLEIHPLALAEAVAGIEIGGGAKVAQLASKRDIPRFG